MITIKREHWKKRGFIVVAREKGKLVTYKKWSRKNNLNHFKQLFKTNKTFDKDITRFDLKNVKEFSDFSKTPHIPRGVTRGQAVARAFISGEEIVARSLQKPLPFDKKQAIDEAVEALYERISVRFGGGYTAEEGLEFVDQKNIKIQTGLVYYKAK